MTKTITILSPGRCGTRMLMESLDQHPDLHDRAGEPLCYNSFGYRFYWDFIRENFGVDPQEYKFMNQFKENTEIFFKIAQPKYLEHVYSCQNLVKILYGHMVKPVVTWLREQDHLFINLSRKNMLDCLISMFYMKQKVRGNNNKTVYIDPTIAFGCVNMWTTYERYCDLWFGRKVIKIYYEDLPRFWYHWKIKIQEAAGLEVRDLKLNWKPEHKEPRRKADIINPEIIPQLQERFGTVIINCDNLE